DLVNILSNPSWTDEDKLAAIKKICDEGNTRDNYTCYLIPIDNVVAEPLFDVVAAEDEIEGEVEPIVPIAPPSPSTTTNIPPCTPAIRPEPQPIVPTPPTKTNSNKFLWSIVVVLLLALAACVAFIMLGGEKESAQQAAPQVEEPVEDAPANLAPPKLDRQEKPQPQQEVITIPAQNPQKQKPRVTLPDGKGKNNPPKINLTPGTGNGNSNGTSQPEGTSPQNMDDLKSRQQGGTQSSSGPDKVPAQSGTPEPSGGKSV
ncbi:MAG: hypothetical protein IIW61_05740, partial [Bacteroidaceae bacterium]|nr:hypothetical protein [Bacteroidaceae bacterium]